jgi:hypothetical protein
VGSQPPDADVPESPRLRFEIRDAVDPDFVEATVGPAFFTHLRAAEATVDFRVRALTRAYGRYENGRSDGLPEPQLGGLGLLVLQRVLFAVEDLGGLCRAVDGQDPWQRLSAYRAWEVDDWFEAFLEGRVDLGELLLLPSKEQLDASASLTDEEARSAAGRLRDLTLTEAQWRLEFAASFWMSHREPAKTTMHGFGVVGSQALMEPPGGGELSELVPEGTARPFAVALISRDDKAANSAQTVHHPLDLTASNIERVSNSGLAACELYRLLARSHRDALRGKRSWILPTTYKAQLTADELGALHRAETA